MLNVYSKIRTFDNAIIKDLEEVIKTAFKVLGQPVKNIKYNLYIVSKAFIHDLNLTARGVDRATDVLSFPTTSILAGEVLDLDKFKLDIDPMDNSLLVGEIFICNEVAKRQFKGMAKDFINAMKLNFIGKGADPNEIFVQDLYNYEPMPQGKGSFASLLKNNNQHLLKNLYHYHL